MIRVRTMGTCSFAVGGTLRRAMSPSVGGRRVGKEKRVTDVGPCEPLSKTLLEWKEGRKAS